MPTAGVLGVTITTGSGATTAGGVAGGDGRPRTARTAPRRVVQSPSTLQIVALEVMAVELDCPAGTVVAKVKLAAALE